MNVLLGTSNSAFFKDLVLSGSDGYNDSRDLVRETVDGVNLNVLWNEFQDTLTIQNSSRQTIVNLLTFPVSQPVEETPQLSSTDFQRSTQYGEPRGTQGAVQGFYLGFDFNWYDLAARFTWQYLAAATAEQVQSVHSGVLEADNRLVFKLVLDALYNNKNRKTNINTQPIPVYALYNADGTVPPRYKSHTFDGTHTHYMTSGAAVVDPEDLDDLYENVAEHGYSKESGCTNLLLVNSREGKTIRKFRIDNGATYDFIPAADTGPFLLSSSSLVGTQVANKYQGLNVIGSYGSFLVIEDDLFPPGYLLHVATGGESSLNNPVGFREAPSADLQGLRLVQAQSQRYPLVDSFYNRGAGTGIRQRGGAAVMQITTSTTYTPPSVG